MGHATINDVNYLNLETKRYKLPSFRFQFHDTQFFYMNAVGEYGHQVGLGGMAEALGVEFTPHRAVDDAYATMRVCEALVKREETDLPGLINRYGVKGGRVAGYRISPPSSRGQKEYYEERAREREEYHRAHEEFYRYVNKYMHRRRKGGPLDGKVFCFAKDVETDVPMSVTMLTAIYGGGGRYTSHPSDCNVYVAREKGGVRFESAMQAGAEFLSVGELREMLDGQGAVV